MTPEALTPDRILVAAEDVLRRHGPAKANVVDVARALGVSHGSVYRHFPSKVALREAVTQRWLQTAHAGLAEIAQQHDAPAPDRLRRWLRTLAAAKRRKALDDPELFATYMALQVDASGVVEAHVNGLVDQLTQIVSDGVARGELRADDPAAAARAVFQATAKFHHPAHAAEWSDPRADADLDRLSWLLLGGLSA